jgi:hypothetical protein
MIHPHQVYSLGELYHEEALKEARARHLGRRAKAHLRSRSEEQGRWLRLGKLVTAAVRLS